jgi:tetratricopeptide (TPR) repeat protein
MEKRIEASACNTAQALVCSAHAATGSNAMPESPSPLAPPTTGEAMTQAIAAYEREQLGEADRLARAILDVKSDYFDALHLLAIISTRQRRFDEALASYDRALALRPDHVEALCNSAVTLQELRRFDEALARYDRALALQPHYAQVLNNRGNVLRQLKRFDEALTSYDRALAVQPGYAEALNNRGNVLQQLQRFDEALASYDRALALRPNYAGALNNRGNALQELQRFDEALSSYDRALALQPGYAEAFNNRGNALHALQRFDGALASYDRALALQPGYAEALNNRGATLHALQRFDEALTSYDRALVLQPNYPEALNSRGNALHALRRFDEALTSYDRALALQPDHAGALYNRGMTLHELRRFDEALASYDRALAAQPDYVEALYNRGKALHELQRFDEALASYDRVLVLQPDHADALCGRGIALHESDDLHAALASYRRALSLKPDLADVYNNMGNALKELGQLQEAESAYCEALRLDPNNTATYINLAAGKTFKPGDAHLAAMEALAAKTEGLSKIDRTRLDFALGKAYADLKDYARSFRHLSAGNAAKRATITYDEQATFALFDRIEAVFTPELIAAKSGGGNPSALPIFVLGMPRSGTTLVEQIIASHPAVHGAGELQLLGEVIRTGRGPDGNSVPYPELTLSLDRAGLHQIGARYVARLGELAAKYGAPGAERITNKMPSNYYFAGLVHLALPNAKIIHTIRDPLDTCMSCFSRLFTAEQNYTYDLSELGRYYRGYERLMAHWRRVLPAGRILDVRYEDVVADLEQQARRIIAYCELPWDDRCLSFHKTDRPVRTASATQVRQPIYTSAIGGWHAYEAHIEPLLNSLGVTAGKA